MYIGTTVSVLNRMGEWMWVATNFCLCTVNLTTLRKTAKRQPSEWKRMSLELNEKIHAICQNNWFTGRVSNLVVPNTKHKSYDHSDKWTVSITKNPHLWFKASATVKLSSSLFWLWRSPEERQQQQHQQHLHFLQSALVQFLHIIF